MKVFYITSIIRMIQTLFVFVATVSTSTLFAGVPSSLNGDGYSDLVIGTYQEAIGKVGDAGVINVIYGRQSGLSAAGDQLWHEDLIDVEGVSEAQDYFGKAIAIGDFNGDGYADTAVGVENQDVNGFTAAGAIHVFYGSATGLSNVNDEIWSQYSSGIEGAAEDDDGFGSALTTGDFNGDGYDDIAIGVPGEDITYISEPRVNAGVVNIIYGSATGLSAENNHYLSQGVPIQDTPELNDFFGTALASGDFNGDGYADLSVGTPHENIGISIGAVNIIYGSKEGLTAIGNSIFYNDILTDDSLHSLADPEVRFFGHVMITGDYNGDSYTDIAIRYTIVPDDSDDEVYSRVNILFGSKDGLGGSNVQVVAPLNTYDNSFGKTLAAGDFDNNGFDDLAIGVPDEEIYTPSGYVNWAGAVEVFSGSSSGIDVEGSWSLDQSDPGILGEAEAGDFFGSALAAGDFNNDSYMDLAIGVPGEDVGTIINAGAVNIVYGSTSGLTALDNQYWTQDSANIEGMAEVDDYFGSVLASMPPKIDKTQPSLVPIYFLLD